MNEYFLYGRRGVHFQKLNGAFLFINLYILQIVQYIIHIARTQVCVCESGSENVLVMHFTISCDGCVRVFIYTVCIHVNV
jgi:hypothetical protein